MPGVPASDLMGNWTSHLQHVLLVNAVVEYLGGLLDGGAALSLPGDVGFGVPLHPDSEHGFIPCSGHRTYFFPLSLQAAPSTCSQPWAGQGPSARPSQ